MQQESGRSLIEVLGVLAVAGVMTAGAIGMYSMIRRNHTRSVAITQLEQIAKNTKILLETRNDYRGVSVEYLIKAGALDSDQSPIGGARWSVASGVDGDYFSINLTDVSESDCVYFSEKLFKWADDILVNGYSVGEIDSCFKSDTNQISFIVR